MDRLWAPWRIKYVSQKKQKGCIFCSALKSREPKIKDYLIFKSRYSFAMLNIFPYNNGHILVSPKRHVRELSLLEDDEVIDLVKSINKTKKILTKVLKPQGFNIGINLGRVAGAGVIGHLHVHILPRWSGDTNFMPTLSGVKVISQSLQELHKIIKGKLC
ncbi:MAG: HIT domain-containing protein [Candidatus Omnitrophica bacterium]|nr:HIT domain-containing protein [Candidatus Omnitrophota bacterium]